MTYKDYELDETDEPTPLERFAAMTLAHRLDIPASNLCICDGCIRRIWRPILAQLVQAFTRDLGDKEEFQVSDLSGLFQALGIDPAESAEVDAMTAEDPTES